MLLVNVHLTILLEEIGSTDDQVGIDLVCGCHNKTKLRFPPYFIFIISQSRKVSPGEVAEKEAERASWTAGEQTLNAG